MKVVDGILASGGALVATAEQASQTVADTVSNVSLPETLTVVAVGVATPILKDLIYKGFKWLFSKIFKTKQV